MASCNDFNKLIYPPTRDADHRTSLEQRKKRTEINRDGRYTSTHAGGLKAYAADKTVGAVALTSLRARWGQPDNTNKLVPGRESFSSRQYYRAMTSKYSNPRAIPDTQRQHQRSISSTGSAASLKGRKLSPRKCLSSAHRLLDHNLSKCVRVCDAISYIYQASLLEQREPPQGYLSRWC